MAWTSIELLMASKRSALRVRRSSIAAGARQIDHSNGLPLFRNLGYRTAVIRDEDQKPDKNVEAAFLNGGGKVFAWRDGRTLEDELFLSLSDGTVRSLLGRAIELHGESLVNEHIKSSSLNKKDLQGIQAELDHKGKSIALETRRVVGKAARTGKAGCFKSVTWMQDVGREIVGPDVPCLFLGLRLLNQKTWAFPVDNETVESSHGDSVDFSSGGPSTRRWKRQNPRPGTPRSVATGWHSVGD